MRTLRIPLFLALCAFGAIAGAETTYVVEDREGYNAWPMISSLGDRLVISYSRGKAHDVSEACRQAIVRTSSDGARSWTGERLLADGATGCNVAEGSGHDSRGNILFWLRCRNKSRITHELYRSSDAVRFERIAVPKLDPVPIQMMDIVPVPGLGLISLWFAGSYRADGGHFWGYLLSVDDGSTWRQVTVGRDLSTADWPTEPSLVWLGGNRLLALARMEPLSDKSRASLLQLQSDDLGKTWRTSRTAMTDVRQSTPALLYDAETRVLTLYYFQRGAALMKRRTATAADAWNSPLTAWSAPKIVAHGRKMRSYDSGNVKAVRFRGSDYLAYYAGDERNASVLVSVVGKGETPSDSLEGRRVLFAGAYDAAEVREFARTNHCEALIYPTREEAYRHHPTGAFARENPKCQILNP